MIQLHVLFRDKLSIFQCFFFSSSWRVRWTQWCTDLLWELHYIQEFWRSAWYPLSHPQAQGESSAPKFITFPLRLKPNVFVIEAANWPLWVFFVCHVLQNDLDDPERGMIFVCSATHKTKSMFFFLAQTEQGDIFKVTLETDEEMVSEHSGW